MKQGFALKRVLIRAGAIALLGMLVASTCVAQTRPRLLPVVGNHDHWGGGPTFIIDQLVMPQRDIIRLRSEQPATTDEKARVSVDYYVDWKNARLIVMDQYGEFGQNKGNYNQEGTAWVEGVIEQAMTNAAIQHIFLAFHEPAFPLKRHEGDAFDEHPEDRNAFWDMIVKYAAKVRAVYNGHTHIYSRIRVKDAAKWVKGGRPDEEGGVYQVNCNGSRAILTEVHGNKVRFLAVGRDAESGELAVLDEWSLSGGETGPAVGDSEPWCFGGLSDIHITSKPGSRTREKDRERNQAKYEDSVGESVRSLTTMHEAVTAQKLGSLDFVMIVGDFGSAGTFEQEAWQTIFPGTE